MRHNATVFNIQRCSFHDGPGTRTTVFLKGCSLHCYWCHNPESLCLTPQLLFRFRKCIGCGACLQACPQRLHTFDLDGTHRIDRTHCIACGQCVDVCYAQALEIAGRIMTPEDVFAEISKDIDYYQASGGGVTFSGGECLLYPDFVAQTAKFCKDAHIHVAIDTAGHVPFEAFEKVLPWIDLFLYDLKSGTASRHHEGTGHSNELILENLNRLSEICVQENKKIWIRIPVIPNFNNTLEEMLAIYRHLTSLAEPSAIELVELLPFHRLGTEKYDALGIDYPAAELYPPDKENLAQLRTVFSKNMHNWSVL